MENDEQMSGYKVTDLPITYKIVGIILSALICWNTYTNTISDKVDTVSMQSAQGQVYVSNINKSMESMKMDLNSVQKSTQKNTSSIQGMQSDINNLKTNYNLLHQDLTKIDSKIDRLTNYLLNNK